MLERHGYAIRQGTCPAWYEFLATQYGLVIGMPFNIFMDVANRCATPATTVMDESVLPPFTPIEVACSWGYGRKAHAELTGETIVLRFPYPRHLGEPLKGVDLAPIEALLASYAVVTSALMSTSTESPWTDRPQTFAVSDIRLTPSSTQSGGLHIWVSGPTADWLNRWGNTSPLPGVSEAMRLAYNRMTNGRVRPHEAAEQFPVTVADNMLTLGYPCEKVQLETHTQFRAESGGLLVGCAITSPIEILVFLAGLSALHMAVRASAIR